VEVAAKSKFKIFEQLNKFDSTFLSYIESHQNPDFKFNYAKGLVSSTPVFLAYRYKLEKSLITLRNFLNNPKIEKFQALLQDVQYDDFDTIVNMYRNKTRYITTVSLL
jgi:hypothetical protein